jgi:pyruvate dehydrogenase E1 component alpha subunit
MVFLGDGATSEGDFHEGMNFAAVFEVPVIFVCQNNQWAISIPLKAQTRSKTLAQKAVGYGLTGIQVDGNDILAVYVAAQEAVHRARTGGGPTFIECVTYRLLMHTTADDPKRYRSESEVQAWQKRDPLVRFERYLFSKSHLTQAKQEEIHAEIQTEIQRAVERAEKEMASMGAPLEMFDHLYAQMPPYLEKQRTSLGHELSEADETDDHG